MSAVCRGARRLSVPLRLLLAVLLFVTAGPAAGQEPPPPPPPPDTLQPPQLDTLPPQDTLPVVQQRALVRFPAMPLGPAAGFAAGEWVWDRDALLREAPTSLADLLERIPSVATFRAGVYAQPEGVAAFGGTAGRLEIELNGFVLDPLAAASFDLAQLPLGQIRELRVQRRLGLLRVRIITDEAEAAEPYTRVEAGIGQPRANLFRGLVLAPHVLIGPLGLAVERLDTDGMAASEPASLFSGWAIWAWTDGTRGVQLELLQGTLEREPRSPWVMHRTRRDVVLRARNSFAPGLAAEVYAGRGAVTDSLFPAPGDTVAERFRRLTSTQVGGRLVWDTDMATVQGRVRYRDGEHLPRLEFGVEADGRVGPARVGGEVSHATREGGDATSYYGLHGELGLVLGASAFAELTGGSRGAPPLRPGEAPLITDRSGWRAGVSVSLPSGRATGSIAAFSLSQDRAYPFGLPFDSAGTPIPADDARGIEAFGRLIVIPRWLAIESSISEWTEAAGWAYVPVRSWRTALESRPRLIDSDNLEILGRLEFAQRSATLVFSPTATADPEIPATEAVLSGPRVDGYLHVRVIDVRMFLRYEHLLGNSREILHLPGRPLPGPRIFYGVKWNLWN
jgi:hypothetical protein